MADALSGAPTRESGTVASMEDGVVTEVIDYASSSIVYHRLIYSTQSVGAMLWSMAQLRRGQLRMVVDVVGSC